MPIELCYATVMYVSIPVATAFALTVYAWTRSCMSGMLAWAADSLFVDV